MLPYPLQFINGKGFFMLALYVSALQVLETEVGEGDNPTRGNIAKALGVSYYKAKVVMDDLADFGFVYAIKKYHRPNADKQIYGISREGIQWLMLVEKCRMPGF